MSNYSQLYDLKPSDFLEKVQSFKFLDNGYKLNIVGLIENQLAASISLICDNTIAETISGYIKYNKGEDTFILGYNAHHHENRQRFTVAHELGHFVLHQNIAKSDEGGIEDNIMYRSQHVSNALEVQANRFAAQMLMPKSLINKYIDEGLPQSLSDMAEAFGVSTTAMAIRLGIPY